MAVQVDLERNVEGTSAKEDENRVHGLDEMFVEERREKGGKKREKRGKD